MSAPVKHTCPDIDKIISQVKSAVKELENAKKLLTHEKIADADYSIDYAIREIEDLCDSGYYGRINNPLEELRRSNSSLREWGEELENENEKLSKKIEELETELNTSLL